MTENKWGEKIGKDQGSTLIGLETGSLGKWYGLILLLAYKTCVLRQQTLCPCVVRQENVSPAKLTGLVASELELHFKTLYVINLQFFQTNFVRCPKLNF